MPKTKPTDESMLEVQLEYLDHLVEEAGWIEVLQRVGGEKKVAAFLAVDCKHSDPIPAILEVGMADGQLGFKINGGEVQLAGGPGEILDRLRQHANHW